MGFPHICTSYVLVYYTQVLNSYSRYGFTVEKVTPDCFEVSDSTLRNPIMCMASLWNGGIHKLRVLAEGDDWGTFLKVCMQPVENTVLEDFFINVPNVVVSYFPVVLYNYLVSGSSGW